MCRKPLILEIFGQNAVFEVREFWRRTSSKYLELIKIYRILRSFQKSDFGLIYGFLRAFRGSKLASQRTAELGSRSPTLATEIRRKDGVRKSVCRSAGRVEGGVEVSGLPHLQQRRTTAGPSTGTFFRRANRAGRSQFAPAMIRKVRGPIVIYGDFIVPMGKEQEAKIQTQFGQRVRELRKQKDLSQEALALACDLDRTYIGGVERGERNISLLNIYKIAVALGVPAKDLFDA